MSSGGRLSIAAASANAACVRTTTKVRSIGSRSAIRASASVAASVAVLVPARTADEIEVAVKSPVQTILRVWPHYSIASHNATGAGHWEAMASGILSDAR